MLPAASSAMAEQDPGINYYKQRKTTLKGSLTRFKTYIETLTAEDSIVNKDEVKYKLVKQDKESAEFDKMITLLICATNDNDKKDELYDENDEYHLGYMMLRDEALKLLGFSVPEPFIQQPTVLESPQLLSKSNIIQNTSPPQVNKFIHLQPIALPTFKGNLKHWPEFADLFKSLVTNNTNLSNVEKLLHLKSCLTDDAAKVICNIGTLDANFDIAWSLLQKRFENPRSLIELHIKALFTLPKIHEDNANSIVEHLNQFSTHYQVLKSNKSLTTDNLLTQFSVLKFDDPTREKWEEYSYNMKEPTVDDITNFLTQRSHIKSASGTPSKSSTSHFYKREQRQPGLKSYMATTSSSNTTPPNPQCNYCNEAHRIYDCEHFLKLTTKARYEVTQSKRLCVNCLGNGHFLKQCKSKRSCFKCHKRHNTLLHENVSSQSSDHVSLPQQSTQTNAIVGTTAPVTLHTAIKTPSQILLSTVLVDMRDSKGRLQTCRALLDNGSQPHIITESFVTKLGLHYTPLASHIDGVGTTSTITKGYIGVQMHSKYNDFNSTIWTTIVDKITQLIPSQEIDMTQFIVPSNVILADPQFGIPSPIDLIIGADIFYQLLRKGRYINKNGPTLQETELGWVISGRYPITYPQHDLSFHVTASNALESQLRKFWELESVSRSNPESDIENYCEKHFSETVTRNESGRFIVRLPFTPLKDEIGSSYNNAVQRLHAIENRLRRNSQLKIAYTQFMKEYEALGHMTVCNTTMKDFFIPHHAVLREHSLTTKLRCVFDASARSSSGISLNDALHAGPVIQDDLVTILLRFRSHPIAFTADIEKMYRQIRVADEDLNYQRIVWRTETTASITTYALNTVTYGTACAPFLSTRCLKELAHREGHKSPRAADILLHDFYVDDCISGCQTASEAHVLKQELVTLLDAAGFPLKKWRSNLTELMEENANTSYILNKSSMNTLGLSWDHLQDCLKYLPSISTSQPKLTKRTVLSDISRLFDPLGLVGPVVLKLKLLMQKLWKLNLTWDQDLPADICKEWTDYRTEISMLDSIIIPRYLLQYPHDSYASIELHGFSDASKIAYGCCIYVRAINIQGEIHTQLICAKSRVAPVKTDTECEATLPRLELCGALLLAQLMHKVRESVQLNISKTFCWCDSTIVLCWIISSPKRYNAFISNRVKDILVLTTNCEWRHVRTDSNPADVISRGLNSIPLMNSKLWWCGPSFLKEDSAQWPQLEPSHPITSRECPLNPLTTLIAVQQLDIVERYSSLVKLVRVSAYCVRFVKNCKSRARISGPISAVEFRDSLHRLIKLEQSKSFRNELSCLNKGSAFPKTSGILSLNPFLDNEGLLRVGGRLRHAAISSSQQHPIILPSHNHLTDLIINYEHLRNLHAGQQSVLASLRTRYWPVSGKSTVRKILRKCVRCCRIQPHPVQHQMGNLPPNRVTTSRPFSSCGIDYCGPFFIVPHHRRGARSSKAYVAVFVCFATKATHLELVGDLTTESCLNALKRFIARRGIITNLYSDNGTNFVGCNNELRRLACLLSTDEARSHLASLQINWHFNPPRSPHFGGLWEAAVKAAKFHLRRVVGQTLLTFEELSTVLVQTEACLNSRPITPTSNDINDLGALTPGHFLIGQPLTALPDDDFTDVPQNRLSHWQRIQQVNQHFWHRWQREYLSQLQQRTKWNVNLTL